MTFPQNITIEYIKNLSYADFVGFINQWNTPPGAFSTISKLALFSKMNESSRVLEVACTTGFSLREFSSTTGCRGVGIDLSENSIAMAIYNRDKYAFQTPITYEVANGYDFSSNENFTHIAVNGGLAFFPDPGKMLDRCLGMLEDGGYILATPYYQTKEMPAEHIQEIHSTLGIPMSSFSIFTYKDMMRQFNNLEIVFEERNKLVQETDEEIVSYCNSIIERACDIHDIHDPAIYAAMHDRLMSIRKLINNGRPYQEYCVLVLRYNKLIHPNRFVALY